MSIPTPPQFELPIWLNKGEVPKLARAAYNWFSLLTEYALFPLRQLDPKTCSERSLNLLAFQRDIERFKDEPLSLYRLRVEHAYINAVESGTVAGFKRIFERLEIGYVKIEERIPGLDWDIINLVLSDSQFSDNTKLLETIIQHYGRTCRRYGYKIINPFEIRVQTAEFSNDSVCYLASLEE